MLRSIPLFMLVVAVLGGGDTYDTTPAPHYEQSKPQIEYKTLVYTHTKVEEQVKLLTTSIPYTVSTTSTEFVTFTTTSTEETPVLVTQTVSTTLWSTTQLLSVDTETNVVVSTSNVLIDVAPVTTTEYLLTTSYVTDQSYFTYTLTPEAVTVLITTTNVVQLPPTTVLQTTTSTRCEFCKLDLYFTPVRFPTTYLTTTVFAATERIFTFIYGPDPTDTVRSTSTEFAPPPCTQSVDKPDTWTTFGVELTSGTTYLIITGISRGYLEPRPTVYGCGELVSVPLELGAAATEFAPLVAATTAVPTTVQPAPSRIVSYLDSLPTVREQLSGVPAYSCDDPNLIAPSSPTFAPGVTGIETKSAAGAVTFYQIPQILAEGAASASASSESATPTAIASTTTSTPVLPSPSDSALSISDLSSVTASDLSESSASISLSGLASDETSVATDTIASQTTPVNDSSSIVEVTSLESSSATSIADTLSTSSSETTIVIVIESDTTQIAVPSDLTGPAAAQSSLTSIIESVGSALATAGLSTTETSETSTTATFAASETTQGTAPAQASVALAPAREGMLQKPSFVAVMLSIVVFALDA